MKATFIAAMVLTTACAAHAANTDKTLVSWVILKDKSVRAGSAITVQLGIEFDAIVFAERKEDRWMAGSDYFLRTREKQDATPVETADGKALIQMAIVYKNDQISIYRNGELYDSYNAKNIDLLSSKDNSVVFGARCVSGVGSIAAAIEDARIYRKALSVEEIKSLKPNKESSIRPYAWWDFEGNKVVDRAGRYSRSELRRGAKLAGGKLVLEKKGMMVAGKMKQPVVEHSRIYSRAKKGTYSIPPELVNFKKTQSRLKVVNAKEFGFDERGWQSDPSRIIYHGGKYHVWMIDGFVWPKHWPIGKGPNWERHVKLKRSWILYMTSKDTVHWKAEHYLPLGPEGSAYDRTIEQANVLHHKGRFYLFAEGWTSNTKRYGQLNAGIICLAADSPEGPWKQVGDILVKPVADGRSWDRMMVLNPRHVHINGKWHMYYKGKGRGVGTENGLAIADSLTGPYTKYKENPLLWGHGHFCWRYKHGMLMLPFNAWTILWSEDGIHFSEPLPAQQLFLFGSLYVPYDSLCGAPVTDKPVTKYWGLESKRVKGRGWDVVRIEWEFGAQEENE